jgi:hypothetical protein
MKAKFKIPIFYGTVVVEQTKGFKAYKKAVMKLGGTKGQAYYSDAMMGVTEKKGYSTYHVIFRGKTTPAMINHEIVHLVNRIFKDTGIRPDLDNDEPQAYLTGWFTKKIFSVVRLRK